MSTSSTPFRVSPADLRALRVLLVLVALAAVATATFRAWPTGPLAFMADLREPSPSYSPADVRPGASAHYAQQVLWQIGNPTALERLVGALPPITLAIAVVLVVRCLWQLVNALTGSDPFAPRTTRLLRQLAACLIGSGLVLPFVGMGASFWLATRTTVMPSVLFTLRLVDFWPVGVGMLVLAVASAFGRGSTMRDDLDGLV